MPSRPWPAAVGTLAGGRRGGERTGGKAGSTDDERWKGRSSCKSDSETGIEDEDVRECRKHVRWKGTADYNYTPPPP